MIVTARTYQSAAEVLAGAHAVRQRLMRPSKLVVVKTEKPALPAPARTEDRPEWQVQPIAFDSHVKAWQWHLADLRKDKNIDYIAKRAIELGSTYSAVVGRDVHRELTDIRQQIMFELRTMKYLSFSRIGRLMKRDHATVMHAVDKVQGQKDGTKAERLTSIEMLSRDTDLLATLKELYLAGARLDQMTKLAGFGSATIVAAAKKAGWYNLAGTQHRAKVVRCMKADYLNGIDPAEIQTKYEISDTAFEFIREQGGWDQ